MSDRPTLIRGLALVLVAALAAACSASQDPSAEPPTTPATPSAEPSRTRDDEGTGRPSLRAVARGLSAPVLVTHAGDGTGDLYVVEQAGTIRVLRGGRPPARPFLDVSDEVVAGGEQGLLGLAFHPDFESDRRFFINYTDTSGDTQVVEYEAGEKVARPDSARQLLTVDQPYANHNGGNVVFGPDGYLYVGMGDGGSGGDPEGNGQDPNALLGKLLRIDVDSGEIDIWALGLRNPWRFTFDEPSGQLWIGDVGQNAIEEVNRVDASERGLNYGWNEMEGTTCYQPGCDPDRFVLPVTEYDHSLGCSVTGGYVYRGADVPALDGLYVFADYCSGTIFTIPADAQRPAQPKVLLSPDFPVSSFGVDEDGELYVVDHGGAVYRFAPST